MTPPLIRKDKLPLARELGVEDRAAERAAVEAGYGELRSYVERSLPHAVPISHDVFAFYDKIAKREGGSVAAVINDTLRKAAGVE